MLLTLLEWSGAVAGAAGALLLAFNNRWSGYGFVLFLLSNACWFSFGVMTGRDSMVFMQIVCTGTTSVGIYRWLILPRLAARRADENPGVLEKHAILAGQGGNHG